MKKKIIFLILILIICGAAVGFYMYYKPHQSIINEKPVYELTSSQLVAEFEQNEKTANDKYLGKVVEISGIINERSRDDKGTISISLAGEEIAGISCEFDKKYQSQTAALKEGDQIKVKGICTGILMDVVLVDCVISK